MGFPRSVKNKALSLAARHCCVCNRFKGVGIEVHHIVQEADGGSNQIDNAIALCFDCHCAAGHYNPRHPRGTKFSPDELKVHRERWHSIVASGNVDVTTGFDSAEIYVRHLVCTSESAAKDLISQNRKEIPFTYSAIRQNSTLEMMKRVITDGCMSETDFVAPNHNHPYYLDTELEPNEFLSKHQEFDGQAERPLQTTDFENDGIFPSRFHQQLVACGFPSEDMGKVQIVEEACGGSKCRPLVRVRLPSLVFAEIRNTSPKPMLLVSLMTRKSNTTKPFSKMEEWEQGGIAELELGNLVLEPGEAVLIPEAIVLGDIDHDYVGTVYDETQRINLEQFQCLGYRDIDTQTDQYWIHPSERVVGVVTESAGALAHRSLHAFDPNRCYVLWRGWSCGSCPHVYTQGKGGQWQYLGEALNSDPGNICTSSFHTPDDAQKLLVAEVDFETSSITKIQVDETVVFTGLTLERGEIFEFEIEGGEVVTIEGRYEAVITRPVSWRQVRQNRSLRFAFEAAIPLHLKN